jgi:hypothetical protein
MMISNDTTPPKANRLRTTSAGPATTMERKGSRRRYSKKKILVLLAACMIVFFAFRGSEHEPDPAPEGLMATAPMTVVDEEEISGENTGDKEVPPTIDCKVYPYKHYSKELKDKLPAYKSLSLQAGIRPIKDEDALYELISKGTTKLVRVEDDDAMYVAPMDYGRPYLKPEAHQVLRSIAADFKERIAHTDLADARLKVTSLLRTSKDQKNLGRHNVNATRDADAPHTHGTSMDISYMKFVSKAGEQLELSGCQQVFLAETLAEVITEHRKRDPMIFAIRERQQACYHLTVCR